MAKGDISAERVREILDYDPITGEFRWKIKKARSEIGAKAGGINVNGYVQIAFDYWPYYGHRMAWAHVHGRWPDGQIDHINGQRSDNRIANLREVSNRVNGENKRAAQKNNRSSSLLGVSSSPSKRNPWIAYINANGKRHNLGSYPTPEQAHAAYVEAKRRLHAGCTI